MPQYIEERLPVTVFAEPGTQLSFTQLLTSAFGDGWTHWTNFWFRSFSAETLTSWNFSYWDPSNGSQATWINAGAQAPTYGSGPDLFLTKDGLDQLVIKTGNSITDTAVFAVETTAPGASDRSFTWYHIKIVDDQLQVLNRAAPTPTDVVNAAMQMDAIYRGVPNANDCGWITDSVGAAAGAVLPALDQDIIPTNNREGGFWRIAHRGTDNPAADWQSLLQAGDIVRFDWADPAQPQHTTMIVRGEDASGNIQVFDNGLWGGAGFSIGIHEANWDDISNPQSVTIYRLTSDNLYLLEGGANGEVLSGTHWNDLIRGNGGGDHIYSQDGNDQIYVAGSASTLIDGGVGFDTAYVAGSTATQVSLSLMNVERVHYSDAVVAFDFAGVAGQAYRLYEAAFDRTPDRPGLSYWVNRMDDGMTLPQVALEFNQSPEFRSLYGAVETMNDGQYLDILYENVLGRDPDPSGFSYWSERLASGYSREATLAAFADSVENQANVANAIKNGILLDLGAFV